MEIVTTKEEDGLTVRTVIHYYPPLREVLAGMLIAGFVIGCLTVGLLSLMRY